MIKKYKYIYDIKRKKFIKKLNEDDNTENNANNV
jgi:hypothetical protein